MRTQEQVLTQFEEWAQGNELVRAAIITSTRANPNRKPDILSDYDIEFYASDIEPFRQSDAWLDHFGQVMVRWPLKPGPSGPWNGITRLVIFRDAIRIDFQIHEAAEVAPDTYDDDYHVLLDKDGLLSRLKRPTYTEHLVKSPTEEEYRELTNNFWWNAHYVPKCLRRDELPFAASMLGDLREEYLYTVVNWRIGLQHGWSVNTGLKGKNFKQYLDAETWEKYKSTFAGPAIEDQWTAFFNTVALFRRLTKLAAEHLGYEYPDRLDREMTKYYHWIRSIEIIEANNRVKDIVAGAPNPHP